MLTYRLLLTLAAPFMIFGLLFRVLRGAERPGDLLQRFGLGPVTKTHVVWLHAASVGEATSARPLIDATLARDTDLHVLVTCNTVTGRARVDDWGLPRVHARLAPLDLRWATALLLRRWRPGALWTLEAEIWPNRFAQVGKRGIPLAWIVARFSDRAARRWGRQPGFSDLLRENVTYVSADSAESEARLRAVGVRAHVFGDRIGLKGAAAQVAAPDLPDFASHYDRADTWLAASTHPGEEEIVLEAFKAARAKRPDLRLILAPRHPPRGNSVASLITSAGWPLCRRSKGGTPTADTPIYLADTLGEMGMWYAMSGTCFVGGSLVDKGGHTPFEPAQAGCAILHGPFLSNFRDSYATLGALDAAVQVEDATQLADALCRLDGPAQRAMADRASAALRDDGEPGAALLDDIIEAKAAP